MNATPEIRDRIPEETALDLGEVAGYDIFLERRSGVLEAPERDDRVDLRHVPTYTIDPLQAHEYDDALSVRARTRDGRVDGYTAYVHVTDVPGRVPEGGLLDLYARENGRTFYYDDGADHMLPQEIVPRISLEEDREREANTVEMRFDGDGELQDWTWYPSLVEVDHNLTFAGANEFMSTVRLNDDLERRLRENDWIPDDVPRIGYQGPVYEDLADEEQEIVDHLDHLHFLGMRLADRRQETLLHSRSPAYLALEEFMVHANWLCARELDEGIYRVHGAPSGWKDRVADYLEQAGVPEAAGRVRDADGPDDVVELQEEIGLPPVFSADAEEKQQAYYATVPRGHEALNLDVYAPFTSPARRYEDIVNWRLLRDDTDLDGGDLAVLAMDLNRQIRPSTFADEDVELSALA